MVMKEDGAYSLQSLICSSKRLVMAFNEMVEWLIVPLRIILKMEEAH